MAGQIYLRVACELSLIHPYLTYTNLPFYSGFRCSYTLHFWRFLPMVVSFWTPSQHSSWSIRTDVYVDEPPILFTFWTTIIVLGREYAAADFRWGLADPTVVSLEILTVLGAGPMCCYILKQLANDDPARHYWLIVLSTAELYGGFVSIECKWRHFYLFIFYLLQLDDLLSGMAYWEPELEHFECIVSLGLSCCKALLFSPNYIWANRTTDLASSN